MSIICNDRTTILLTSVDVLVNTTEKGVHWPWLWIKGTQSVEENETTIMLVLAVQCGGLVDAFQIPTEVAKEDVQCLVRLKFVC